MHKTKKQFHVSEETKTVKNFRLGELFCGPGGIALGAMSAQAEDYNNVYKIKHAWANDFDEDTCKTYSRNICPEKPETVYHGDIRQLNIKDFPPIDAFAYGFPCNDFSIVGEQKGFDGEYGPLYLYGIDVINHLKPKFFLAENVGGMASANEGRAFHKILEDLEDAGSGYNLTVHLYKAEEYGVPQTRHRIVIVGIDKRLEKKFRVPAPVTRIPISARVAFEVPPIPHDAHNNEHTRQSPLVVERLKVIRPGQNVWNSNLPAHLQLNVKGARMSQIYKRLHPELPSYTITGSGGGGTHGYHWSEPRALTNRERARLQTFPDSYIFEGSKESVRKQIGMAVPAKLAEHIFTAVLKTMAGIDYPSIAANGDDHLDIICDRRLQEIA